MGPDQQQGSQSKGEQTRRTILKAAIARFGRDGFRSTSVADIARDASVGGTVAYAYFPNKEALFFAAVDKDVAAVIGEAVATVTEITPDLSQWHTTMIYSLVESVERHSLARRLLAGLEPEVTLRVLELPALMELRKACIELLRSGQAHGSVRPDIDPATVGNGIVSIMLALLMAVTQLGNQTAVSYAPDVVAVLEAALAESAAPGPPESEAAATH
jgi:AcrR family transcriptional regulator